MANRLLHNTCNRYVAVSEILTELSSYDDESLKPIKEEYTKEQEYLIKALYTETERLGGDKPRKQSNYWDSEPARVIVHRILVKARELDFAKVSYEDYVDKDSLLMILKQLDHCCKYKEELK